MAEVQFSQVHLPHAMHLPSRVLVDYLPEQAQEVHGNVETRLLDAPVVRALQVDYPDSLPWAEPVRLARRVDNLAKWRGFLVGTLAGEEAFERFVTPGCAQTLEAEEARYQIAKAVTAYSGLIFVARGVVGWPSSRTAERNMKAALLERDENFGWSVWSQLHQQYLKRKIEFADEYLSKSI